MVAEPAPEVSLVLPCLNEEETLGDCIASARQVFLAAGIEAEIVVCDNGSRDRSMEIATEGGAIVVREARQGYGYALRRGIEASHGRYVVIADADGTYDLTAIPAFLEPLRNGYAFVVGDRFRGGIEPGAMPWMHRHVGTPLLSLVLRALFRLEVKDSQCGMRAFSRDAYQKMRLRTGGMEFASEMLVNAARARLALTQVPVRYFPRRGVSKLRSVPDGWRHVRFMLLHSPTYFYWIPCVILLLAGLSILAVSTPAPVEFAGRQLDVRMQMVGSMLTILGFQVGTLGLFARTFAVTEGFDEHDAFLEGFYRRFTLERGILIGMLLLLGGGIALFYFLGRWISGSGAPIEIRLTIFALTLIVVGSQVIFSSHLISLMGIRRTHDS